MNKEQTAILERIAIALEYISEDLKALRDMAEEVNKPTDKEPSEAYVKLRASLKENQCFESLINTIIQ